MEERIRGRRGRDGDKTGKIQGNVSDMLFFYCAKKLNAGSLLARSKRSVKKICKFDLFVFF